MVNYTRHPASFKDPSGFVFQVDGQVYRQVNQEYASEYDHLMNSGLYKHLVQKRWLIPHEEINQNLTETPKWYKTLRPEQVSTISYPYEWLVLELKVNKVSYMSWIVCSMSFL